jgi:hypothetical protein
MAIKVTTDDKENLSVEIHEELQSFDFFFQEKLKNTPLTHPERAILKTYLQYAILEKNKNKG